MSGHLTHTPEDDMTRTDKFTVALFGLFSVLVIGAVSTVLAHTLLVIVPGLVFAAIAIVSPGAIDLGH